MAFQVPSGFDEIHLHIDGSVIIFYVDNWLGSNTAVPDTEQVQASRLASDEMSK